MCSFCVRILLKKNHYNKHPKELFSQIITEKKLCLHVTDTIIIIIMRYGHTWLCCRKLASQYLQQDNLIKCLNVPLSYYHKTLFSTQKKCVNSFKNKDPTTIQELTLRSTRHTPLSMSHWALGGIPTDEGEEVPFEHGSIRICAQV